MMSWKLFRRVRALVLHSRISKHGSGNIDTMQKFGHVTREHAQLPHHQSVANINCIWKQIPGFSKYEASTSGFITFKATGRVLKGSNVENGGFSAVQISKDNLKKANCRIDRLVLKTFSPQNGDDSRLRVVHIK